MGADHNVLIDGETYGIANDYLALAGAVLLIIFIVIWFRARGNKAKTVRRHAQEITQVEVYTRLRKLDDELMTAVMSTIKHALPRPESVKPKRGGPPPRRNGLPGTEAVAAAEAAAVAAALDAEDGENPPPPPPRNRTVAQEAEKELGDDIALLFGADIAPPNNLGPETLVSAISVRRALIKFLEEHVFSFVNRVARHTYSTADKVFKTTGLRVFDPHYHAPSKDMMKQGHREALVIPWRLCCCVCPGTAQKMSLSERNLMFSALRDRMLAHGGVKTFEAAHDYRPQAGRVSIPGAQVIAPCVRHGWVSGAHLGNGDLRDVELLDAPQVNPNVQPKEEPRPTEEECKELEALFSRHYSLFMPPCLDSRNRGAVGSQTLSQSPFVLRIDDMDENEEEESISSPADGASTHRPRYSEHDEFLLKTFALTAAQDRSLFACPDVGPNGDEAGSASTMRGDVHLYLQLLRNSVLYFDELPKKVHHAMYDLVPSLDAELKAWLKDAVEFFAEREAENWRKDFMALAKQIIDFEVQAANGRIKDRKTKGEYSTDFVDATIERQRQDNGEEAVRQLECRSSQGELVDKFKDAVKAEFATPFHSEVIDEAPETKASCCGFCLPDLPAIRRQVPPSQEKIVSSMKGFLKDIVLGDARTEEHLKEARAELSFLRDKLLDLMYPPGSAWNIGSPLGGASGAGGGAPQTPNRFGLTGSTGANDIDVIASPTDGGIPGASTPQGQGVWSPTGDDMQTPGGGTDVLPLVSMEEIVDNRFRKMLERLERTVTGAVNRREERVALEVIQHNPIINKDVQGVARTLFQNQQPWMDKYSRNLLILKKLHRQSKDLCAIGREYDVQFLAGASAPATMIELMFDARESFELLESEDQGGAEFMELIPFEAAVKSFNHWAARCDAPPYIRTSRPANPPASSTQRPQPPVHREGSENYAPPAPEGQAQPPVGGGTWHAVG